MATPGRIIMGGGGTGATVYADFGVEPTSIARLRDAKGRLIKLNETMRVAAEWEQDRIAHAFLEELKRTFEEKHPGTGRTVSTFQVMSQGFWSTITMGGAAEYIEAGTPPHAIVGNPLLQFMWQGEVIYRNQVYHPGIASDPFLERAAARLDLRRDLQKIYSKAWGEVSIGGKLLRDVSLGGNMMRDVLVKSGSVF